MGKRTIESKRERRKKERKEKQQRKKNRCRRVSGHRYPDAQLQRGGERGRVLRGGG